MAVDMFLKLGTSRASRSMSKHKERDRCAGLELGYVAVGNDAYRHRRWRGQGQCRGHLDHTNISTRPHPISLLACCTGKHYPDALLTVRKAGENPLEYLKITMKDVLVSSCHPGGSNGEDRLTEQVMLNFAEYKMEYTPQKADGSGDAAVTAGFHIAQNVKV